MKRISREAFADSVMRLMADDSNWANLQDFKNKYFCKSSRKSKGKSVTGKNYHNFNKYSAPHKHAKLRETERRRNQIAKGIIPAHLVHKVAHAETNT